MDRRIHDKTADRALVKASNCGHSTSLQEQCYFSGHVFSVIYFSGSGSGRLKRCVKSDYVATPAKTMEDENPSNAIQDGEQGGSSGGDESGSGDDASINDIPPPKKLPTSTNSPIDTKKPKHPQINNSDDDQDNNNDGKESEQNDDKDEDKEDDKDGDSEDDDKDDDNDDKDEDKEDDKADDDDDGISNGDKGKGIDVEPAPSLVKTR